jgi:hypothetical protein
MPTFWLRQAAKRNEVWQKAWKCDEWDSIRCRIEGGSITCKSPILKTLLTTPRAVLRPASIMDTDIKICALLRNFVRTAQVVRNKPLPQNLTVSAPCMTLAAFAALITPALEEPMAAPGLLKLV